MQNVKLPLSLLLLGLVPQTGMAATADTLIAKEILGRPTDQSITLNAVAGYATDAYVRFGIVSGKYTDSTAMQSFSATDPMVVEINKLSPNQKYFYELMYRRSGSPTFTARPEHYFQTQRSLGSAFQFNIIADAHMHDKKGIRDVMNQTLTNQLQSIPDFLIDMGDNFGDDHNPTTITKEQLWTNRLNMREYYGQINHSSPLFLVMGNHEGESGYWLQNGGTNQMALNATLGRKFYYNNPIPNNFYTGNNTPEANGVGLPENYYAWTWGDAEFIVLDAYRGYTVSAKPRSWEWTLGKEQYDWFKSTLEKSTSKYKFVFAHHVLGETRGGLKVAMLNEWGGYSDTLKTKYDFDTERPTWGKPIHQLMVDHKVNIFFQGHDHLFAKENVDGVVYQTCPMPSDSTYRIGIHDNGDAFAGDTLEGSGHMQILVNSKETKVEFVTSYLAKDESLLRKNNATVYSYTVNDQGQISALQKEIKTTIQPLLKANAKSLQVLLPQAGEYQFSIYHANGQFAQQWTHAMVAGEQMIPLQEILSSGFYILKVQSKAGVWTQDFQI